MKANPKTPARKLLLIASVWIACLVFAAIFVLAADEPGMDDAAVRVEPTNTVGPRTLEKQTETAVVRDYLDAWRSLSAALAGNRADLLDADFVGTAKQKLADTIHEQARLGIETRYRDTAHDLRLTFYSPEGMSLQLLEHRRLRSRDRRSRQGAQRAAGARPLRGRADSHRSPLEGARVPGRAAIIAMGPSPASRMSLHEWVCMTMTRPLSTKLYIAALERSLR